MSEVRGKDVVVFYDPEVSRKNPIDLKHSNLSRHRRPTVVGTDVNIKPNPEEREELKVRTQLP